MDKVGLVDSPGKRNEKKKKRGDDSRICIPVSSTFDR